MSLLSIKVLRFFKFIPKYRLDVINNLHTYIHTYTYMGTDWGLTGHLAAPVRPRKRVSKSSRVSIGCYKLQYPIYSVVLASTLCT